MKRFVAVVCLFLIGATVLAAAPDAPSLVRVSGLSDKEMSHRVVSLHGNF